MSKYIAVRPLASASEAIRTTVVLGWIKWEVLGRIREFPPLLEMVLQLSWLPCSILF
jgi:hypothetical protein